MIVGIPTAEEFQNAGLNLLHLGWAVAVKSVHDIEEADELSFDLVEADEAERKAAHEAYWRKRQPALANAFALVQQGIELTLKGRIAAVTPYLLIARDARDYPSGSEKNDVEFSAFRSLDAADLFRVHNTHCSPRLGDDFREFWDKVRRQRNTLMHAVAKSHWIEPVEILGHVLTANRFLFGDVRWVARRLARHADDEFAEFPTGYDTTRNAVMNETASVLRWLSPAQAKDFYGFDKRQRTYMCTHCYGETDHHFRDELPLLAQLRPKSPKATTLWCCVCDNTCAVTREKCASGCESNVISAESDWAGTCLMCMREQ